MKLGIRLPPCGSPAETAQFVVQAETNGFDSAWIPDSHLLWHDIWVTMGAVGMRTSRITVGVNVTNPITRHFTVTASAAAAMDDLTGGRFVLGYGSGESAVKVMAMKAAKIAQMRGDLALMRSLWAGDFINPYGRRVRLQSATGRQVPVYLGAAGPKMLQFAGEVADGVVLPTGIPAESIDRSLSNIEIGARRAGRRLEEIAIYAYTYCHVDDNWRQSIKVAQPYAALFAIRHREALQASGIQVPEAQDVSGIYPDLSHAEDWEQAIAATNWVPEEVLAAFCDKFCIVGTGDEVAAKIKALASYGIQNLIIRDFFHYTFPTTLMNAFVQEVFPRLGDR